MKTSAVTVRQLLALDVLPGHRVIGGDSGLDRRVTRVMPCADAHWIKDVPPGTLIVFTPGAIQAEHVSTDLALRMAHSAAVAGLVLEATGRTVSLATTSLADRLSIPLVVVDSIDTGATVTACDEYVRAPEIAALRIVSDAVHRFRTAPTNARQLIAALSRTVDADIAMVDAEGRLVAGAERCHRLAGLPEGRNLMSATHPRPGSFTTAETESVVLQPIQLAPHSSANLWLVAATQTCPNFLLDAITQAMTIAALSYSVLLASRTAHIERESRHRSMLLGEILDQADDVSPRTLEKSSALRWRLGGWHTAVYITWKHTDSAHHSETLTAIEESLAGYGIDTAVIEQSDGYVFWTTSDDDDTAHEQSAVDVLAPTVRSVLSALDKNDDYRFCAGIGGAEFGAAGIKKSIVQAKQAATVARSASTPFAVEHVTSVSTARLLSGWFEAQSMRDGALGILEPLTVVDPSGDLVKTLSCYLDNESSATATAHALGLHRNTVLQRLERVRAALGFDLTDPDDRLILHLSTRVSNMDNSREDPLPHSQ
ncbi:purine catabolism regulator [Rhodococcus sp. 27YEA15]|uniref:helix-turn-helix domain-containing protein n=1 Tax=Rhodococcus sp. 27YEA15 TaxID=3156259 RepID=UPI003C7E5025